MIERKEEERRKKSPWWWRCPSPPSPSPNFYKKTSDTKGAQVFSLRRTRISGVPRKSPCQSPPHRIAPGDPPTLFFFLACKEKKMGNELPFPNAGFLLFSSNTHRHTTGFSPSSSSSSFSSACVCVYVTWGLAARDEMVVCVCLICGSRGLSSDSSLCWALLLLSSCVYLKRALVLLLLLLPFRPSSSSSFSKMRITCNNRDWNIFLNAIQLKNIYIFFFFACVTQGRVCSALTLSSPRFLFFFSPHKVLFFRSQRRESTRLSFFPLRVADGWKDGCGLPACLPACPLDEDVDL